VSSYPNALAVVDLPEKTRLFGARVENVAPCIPISEERNRSPLQGSVRLMFYYWHLADFDNTRSDVR
jgi:hypothetical protein